MNPWAPFTAFLILGTAWTLVWLWVVVRSRDVATVPFERIAVRGERLRIKLFAIVGIVLLLALIVSIPWLPYRVFAVARLGPPTVRVTAAREKFEVLAAGIDAGLRGALVDAVSRFERTPVSDLTQLLEGITPEHHA